MSPDRLIANFNRLVDGPNSIPRFRQLILDLAVRGKLVEQDPGDEPASKLFERIQMEKKQLFRDGKSKRPSEASPVENDAVPFEIPGNWSWVRLIDVLTKLTDGTHHSPPNGETGDFMYVTAKNIKPEGVSLSLITNIAGEIHGEIFARCNPEKGDILYVKDGATTGVVTINDLDEPFSMLSSVALLKLPTKVYNRLLVSFLRSPFFYSQMRGFMKGAAITRVTLKRMSPALIPLPPLAEQHRIVAKVDELMALCDRLEAAQKERENRQDHLVAASLHRLNNSADAESFREHARFHLRHLPRLTTRAEHIKKLRQTILNLAVRGRLVPQDPNDEPATELLKRIQEWRVEAIQRKEIREPRKPLTIITEDDFPYERPSGWEWVRLGNLMYIQSGDGLTAENMKNGDIPVFGGNGINGHHDSYNVNEPTIVIGRVGYYCGSIHVTPPKAWVTDNAFITRFDRGSIYQRFLVLLLIATNLKENEKATAQPVISGSKLYPLVVGLPSVAEQHRIVAKVDELMNLCDELEAQVTTTQTESRRLLDATLRQALAGKRDYQEAAP